MSEDSVCDDLFNEGAGLGGGLLFLAGQVDGGDLESVKEQAGSFRVKRITGDASEHLADAELDGGAVFWQRQVKGGGAAAARFEVSYGFAGGVMVVAEKFLFE